MVITIKERTGLCQGRVGDQSEQHLLLRHKTLHLESQAFATGEMNSLEEIFLHNEIHNGSC